ncbi:alpha/beta fold hydrolase [Virgibacillus dakarensis]|uniref:alpha/beta fold hydrolase n=1 Tax=Virgibacillus dakarensis TaxID=1917889 RepID=UPI000B44E448|nr:alpha/beta hydrolase [Virgibacillus dakarensis]MTW87782.1 alpha/beta fold hydrolase [Virgibacillus dakarensis]
MNKQKSDTPIILVPGFWLGAWAWNDVTDVLRADGYNVRALTLPGLESNDTDRSAINFSDHVDAICDAVKVAGEPVVLAVHSATGATGYAVSDRMPEQIAAMVYVDSFPEKDAMNPEFDSVEMPFPSWKNLDEADINGMSDEHRNLLRQRAVPEPGGAVREAPVLTNDRRLDVPSTIICTAHTSDEIKSFIEKGWLSGLEELNDVTYVDLPTHHWPMLSRPKELAAALGDVVQNIISD